MERIFSLLYYMMNKTTNIIEMESSSLFCCFDTPSWAWSFIVTLNGKCANILKIMTKTYSYSTMNVCATQKEWSYNVCAMVLFCKRYWGLGMGLRHNLKEKLFEKDFYYFKSFWVEYSANMYNFAITIFILFLMVNKRYVYVLYCVIQK